MQGCLVSGGGGGGGIKISASHAMHSHFPPPSIVVPAFVLSLFSQLPSPWVSHLLPPILLSPIAFLPHYSLPITPGLQPLFHG